MNRREFLTRSGITVTSLGVSQVLHGRRLAAKTGSLSKCHNANILMITCHDIGRHIGCYCVKTVQTDNIDGLAKKGVRFQNYFATDVDGEIDRRRVLQSSDRFGILLTDTLSSDVSG